MSVQVGKLEGWTAWATAHLAFVSLVMASLVSPTLAQDTNAASESKPATSVPDSSTPAATPGTFEGNTLKYQTNSSSSAPAALPVTNASPSASPSTTGENSSSPSVPLADRDQILIAGDFVIPPGRPDWIEKFSEAKEQPTSKQVAICSGPFTTEAEARNELFNKARHASDRYIESTLGSPQASMLLGYSGEQVKSRFVNGKNEYVETVTFSVGPMKQVHALVQFTPEFDGELHHRWRQIRSVSRVGVVALVGAVVLSMLLTFFGYLRADTSTRGYYTTRLKFAAGGAILAIVVAGFVASRWVHWL
jgi:hypothetical protein